MHPVRAPATQLEARGLARREVHRVVVEVRPAAYAAVARVERAENGAVDRHEHRGRGRWLDGRLATGVGRTARQVKAQENLVKVRVAQADVLAVDHREHRAVCAHGLGHGRPRLDRELVAQRRAQCRDEAGGVAGAQPTREDGLRAVERVEEHHVAHAPVEVVEVEQVGDGEAARVRPHEGDALDVGERVRPAEASREGLREQLGEEATEPAARLQSPHPRTAPPLIVLRDDEQRARPGEVVAHLSAPADHEAPGARIGQPPPIQVSGEWPMRWSTINRRSRSRAVRAGGACTTTSGSGAKSATAVRMRGKRRRSVPRQGPAQSRSRRQIAHTTTPPVRSRCPALLGGPRESLLEETASAPGRYRGTDESARSPHAGVCHEGRQRGRNAPGESAYARRRRTLGCAGRRSRW